MGTGVGMEPRAGRGWDGPDLAALLLPEDGGRRVPRALALEGDALPGGDGPVTGAGDQLGGHCRGEKRARPAAPPAPTGAPAGAPPYRAR